MQETLQTKHLGSLKIKQHSEVTYLGCILDESLSGESMASNAVSKINTRLKFLYQKSKFLSHQLRRFLCNALIQPHFDYICSVWYPNLNKKTLNKGTNSFKQMFTFLPSTR